MIKILLSLVLAVSIFSGNVSASTIQQSIDELNYELTVEWDQKDQAFLANSISNFKAKLALQGISNEELVKYVAKTNNITEEELIEALRANAVYMQGASWNGVIYVLGGIGLGVTLFFTIVILDSLDITG